MNFEEVLYERRGVAGWITLHRPHALNALTPTMVGELAMALDTLERDEEIRVVLLTGAGRAFCVGADLKASKERTEGDEAGRGAETTARFLESMRNLMDRLEHFPKPVIAAVNGIAAAGGLELMLCCDLVIAAEAAKIGDAHANYGLLPGGGASVRLPRTIGAARAKYLMFTGQLLAAAELVHWGLVNQVVPADQLVPTVTELAGKLSAKSPLVLRRMKQLIDDGLQQPRDVALRNELVMSALHFYAHDRMEGLKAFVEKRQPQFVGR